MSLQLAIVAAAAAVVLALLASRLRQRHDDRRLEQASHLHFATLEALVRAINAKDQTSAGHVERVQWHAAGLGSVLGMPADEVQAIRTAALLHDIGNLAIPEHVLSKPGPLTAEEWQKVRTHPQVGAEILAGVPFPHPVTPLIQAHHERWDGRGYPAGLRGADIPLGARILAVVDYYDALTSDRPYHKAMRPAAAQRLLQQESGKALDPTVVDAFLRALPELEHQVLAERPRAPVATVAPQTEGGEGAPLALSERSALDDIALAHREIHGLYEIAQVMGTNLGITDMMALLALKLAPLVPHRACALFLVSDKGQTMRCRFATGTDASIIETLVVASGRGLTGWVARNRRPLVNSLPAVDFEAGGATATTSLQSALICPLVFQDRVIGTLAVYHAEPRHYTDDHRRLLDRVCEQAGAVVHNAVLFEQTREDAMTDPLTSLPNTRFMFHHLTRELSRTSRLKGEMALLILDLDDFKEINDSYGHHVGDQALCAVARVLLAGIRQYDMCVRYAGDEFIVLLSSCGRDEAERKRKELQQAVDELVLNPHPDVQLALKVSAGSAVYPHDGTTYETMLAHADGEMYQDKRRRKVVREKARGAGGEAHRDGASAEPDDDTAREAGSPGPPRRATSI